MGSQKEMEKRKSLIFTLKVRDKYQFKKEDLLVDGEPVYFLLPKLIELLDAIGYRRRRNSLIAEALILQQIHLETEKFGIVFNTYKWIEGNIYNWLKDRFSMIKYIKFENALNGLIKDGFITILKIDDDKEFFRINYKRFFYSQKIKKAQEQKKRHIQKLREYKARKKAGTLNRQLRGKLMKLEEKLKKKKTKAVFFKIS